MSVGTPDSNVVPTGEQYARAMTYVREQDNYQNDHDLGRSTDEWERDVFLGELAEHVAEAEISALGMDVRLVTDDEDQSVDLLVDEDVGIDVKARYLWQRDDPDLIVRAASNPDADAYLMAEIGQTETGYNVSLTGWVARQEVIAYGEDFLPGRSKHSKLLVDRKHLRDIDSLPDYLDLLGGDRL